MQMNDSRIVAAPVEIVWAAILNPEVLRALVPGCTELTGTVEDGFEATVVQKVGPVKATFKGQVRLAQMEAPTKVTLEGEGKGGAAGFAKGSAVVVLTPVEEGTLLDYTVEAKVGGKLAQLGSRVIDGFAKKMADQFFQGLQEAVEEPDAETADGSEEDDSSTKTGWFRRILNS